MIPQIFVNSSNAGISIVFTKVINNGDKKAPNTENVKTVPIPDALSLAGYISAAATLNCVFAPKPKPKTIKPKNITNVKLEYVEILNIKHAINPNTKLKYIPVLRPYLSVIYSFFYI